MMDIYKNWKLYEIEIGINFSWGNGGIKDTRDWMLNIGIGFLTFQFYPKSDDMVTGTGDK